MKASSKRDNSLDYLKGIACILMMIGHAALFDRTGPITREIYFIGAFGHIFFFTVSGITTRMQLGRYSFQNIFITYLFIGLLGTSFTAIMAVLNHDTTYNRIEIIQLIALGCIFSGAVHHFFRPKIFYYLIIAITICGIKFLFDLLFDDIAFSKILFPPNDFVTESRNVFPGSPIFPWLFLFPMGIYVYYNDNRHNLIGGILSTVLLVFLSFLPVNIDIRNRWDMSIGYGLLNFAIIFWVFYFTRKYQRIFPGKKSLVLFFGKNSLMFLFLHGVAIGLTAAFYKANNITNQYAAWIQVFVLTTLYLLIMSKIPKIPAFKHLTPWIILTLLILGIPLFIKDPTGIFYLELILGIIFAHHYTLLTKAIKK